MGEQPGTAAMLSASASASASSAKVLSFAKAFAGR
jgi:hypothetical protein